MNSFIQHIPPFVDVDAPAASPFETTEDLLALEVVQRYGKRPDFSHFAMSDNALMEISDGGHHWWVVGFVADPEQVNLPKWDGGKYRAELLNGERIDLQCDDVVMSRGDVLTLRDGTKARWLREPSEGTHL
jgi:hypothetical protein